MLISKFEVVTENLLVEKKRRYCSTYHSGFDSNYDFYYELMNTDIKFSETNKGELLVIQNFRTKYSPNSSTSLVIKSPFVFKSAYCQFKTELAQQLKIEIDPLHSEPLFTYYGLDKIVCVDFIFSCCGAKLDKGLPVVSCLQEPPLKEVLKAIKSMKVFPSDHIPLCVDFSASEK